MFDPARPAAEQHDWKYEGPGGLVQAKTAPCGSRLQRKHIAQASVVRPAVKSLSFYQ